MVIMDSEVKAIIKDIWKESRNKEYKIIEEVYKNSEIQWRFLEVGCGSLGLLTKKDRLSNLIYNSYGVDINIEELTKNEQVKYRICSSCYNLPFKKNTFYIIVCRWLFEHLEYPESAIKEFSRVLKKGGYLFITTPNLYNYTMLISKFTPLAFHNWFRRKSYGKENIQTFYRANTKGKIVKLALQNGFVIKYFGFTPGSFVYYRFNKFLFFIMIKISNYVSKFFSIFHLKITCLAQKIIDV